MGAETTEVAQQVPDLLDTALDELERRQRADREAAKRLVNATQSLLNRFGVDVKNLKQAPGDIQADAQHTRLVFRDVAIGAEKGLMVDLLMGNLKEGKMVAIIH